MVVEAPFPTQCINPVQLRARVGYITHLCWQGAIPVYVISKPVDAGHERERERGGRFIEVEREGAGGRNDCEGEGWAKGRWLRKENGEGYGRGTG